MIKEVKNTLSINGKFIENFEQITLSQTINEHHTFEVLVDQEVIESAGAHNIDKSKNWLGKPLVIGFDEYEFIGLITNVRLIHQHGHHGKLLISGYSNTIKLEAGFHMESWLEKKLEDIVKATTDAAALEAEIAPVYKDKIEYQSQYLESHYTFLKRLAAQYNEWLYYDGVKLIFGKPSSPSPVNLEYGKDANDLEMSIMTIPNKQSMFTYNSGDDKKEQSQTKDEASGLSELGMHAFNTSKEAFPIVPNTYAKARVSDKSQLENLLKTEQNQSVAACNQMTLISNKQGLSIGSIIKLNSAKYDNKSFDVQNYGEYLIIEILHTADQYGHYQCKIKAIPSGIEVLPAPQVDFPTAENQIATVLSNEDPKGKGRVQVQFQWQTGEMKTSWLRVLSPDAGSSDKVSSNRGFVFIPEEGDTVMVGFRYNDPNRPFIMGSLFNGTTGGGGGSSNNSKSLITKSGSVLSFDESAGSTSLTDAKGNTAALDGAGNISVSSSESIALTCGASSIVLLKDGTIAINGKEVVVSGSKSSTMMSGASNSVVATAEKGTVDVGAAKVNLNGSTETNVHANAKTTVSAGGKVALQGAIVSLN